jgi:AcrR family transcriptional regulator
MKASKVVRRRPRQARSQSTVEAIYEATGQIIEREGADRVTMNRISDVSGYSIGTLYQYFHDRDSLLMAMAIAHRDRLIERLKVTLAASRDTSSCEAISDLLEVILADARSKRKILRAVVCAVARKEMAVDMLGAMRVLDEYIGRSLGELAGSDGLALSPVGQFVLSRSLTCVLWSAVMEDSDLLDCQELEDQLRNMLTTTMIRGAEFNISHAEPNAQSNMVIEHP